LFVGNRRLFGVIDEALRAKREAVWFQHMTDENAHVFDQAIAAFAMPATRSSRPAKATTAPSAFTS